MKNTKSLALLFALLASFQICHATTFIWTNTLGGNWSVAANWSPNFVPGQLNGLNSSDDVLITNDGTYTVVLDEGTAPNFWDIQSLTLGGGGGTQTLAMTNKIFYVAPLIVTNGGVLAVNSSDFHADITVQNGGNLVTTNGNYYVNPFIIGNGGTFTTRGNIILESGGVLENAGALNVSNGVLTLDMPVTNSGTMTVNAGAGITIDRILTLFGPLTNSGTMTINGNDSGMISISNDLSTTRGGIVNLSGGVINLNNFSYITGGNNHEFFVNQGTINSAGGNIESVPGFTNSGAINATANTLYLDSGLHLQPSGSLNLQLDSASDYGKFSISGNAALAGALNVTLGDGFNPQNGNSFQPVTYSSFSGNFTSTNLPTLVPWQMTYGSSAVTLQVTTETITWTNTLGGNWSDPNNWSPNIVPGGAAYGNDDDAVITAAGTYTVVFDEGTISSPYYLHSLTLGGSEFQTLIVSNKWLDAATMTVNFGGIVDSTSSYWFNNWVTPLTINDRGFFNSTNDLFNQNVTVNTGGNFSVVNSTNGNGALTIEPNGALKVPAGNFVLNGTATNSGTVTISGGASLSVNDNLVLSGKGYIGNQSGGTIDISGGNGISGDNGGETLNNQGTIISSGGYILSVPNFSNSGEINLLTGTLNLDSGLQLQSSGSLNFQLNSASDYGKITISGNAALNGAFAVALNYSPNAGDSFTPLTYSSYSGNFSSYNLPASGTGQSWQHLLGATALTLQIAETVTWTNTDGGNWSDAANWSPNKVPGIYDDVGITTPGTYTVNVDTSPNIKSLTLGTGGGTNGTNTLSIVNKTFYVNPLTVTAGGILTNNSSTFHAVITVENGGQLNSVSGIYYVNPLTIANGGTLNANNDTFHQSLVVANGGVLNTPGAEIASDGSLTMNGALNIPSGVLYLYGPMTNSGIISIYSNGGIYIYNNNTASYQGDLINLPTGTINLNGGNGIQVGPFINQGSVVSTGNGAQILTSPFDTSAGTVTNLNGRLLLSAFTNTLAGTFYATNGATIWFRGGTAATPLTPGSPLVLSGGGTFEFNLGWLDLPTDIIPNLQLTAGTLELGENFQGGTITNLALDGMTLTNGSAWSVTGTFNVTNSPVYGNYTVENGTTLNANGATFHGNLIVANGGVLNTPGAEIASDGSLTMNGALNIPSGVLTLYGPMTNSGIISIYSNGGIYIYNNNTASYQGGLINLPIGTINLNGFNGIQGGFGNDYFINQGSVVSTVNGAQISMSDFTNSGAITSLEGQLNLNKISLQSSGSLNVRLNSKTDYGKFSISGAAALNGAFGASLNGTYVPGVGDSFTPLTYGSFTGNFTATNLPQLVAWQTTYDPTALTLLVTQTGLIPEFTTIASSAGNLIFNGTNGAPGATYWVLTGTNLTEPLADWTPVATNTFDGVGRFSFTNTPDAGKPQQFFILLLPQ